MTTNIENPGKIPADIEQKKKSLGYLDSLVDRNHPLFQEYERLSVDAERTILTMESSRKLPNGLQIYHSLNEHFASLWERAMGIRSQMVYSKLRSVLGVAPGVSLEATYEKAIGDALGVQSKEMEALKKKLLSIVRSFDTDPQDTLKSFINLKTDTASFLQNLKQTSLFPELRTIATNLENAYHVVESIDPIRSEAGQRFRKHLANSAMDWRPLQTIGFGLSSLLIGVGLVKAFVKGDTSPDPAMGFWAVVGAFCNPRVRHSILGSLDSKTLEKLNKFGKDNMLNAIATFRGNDGVQSFETLQSFHKDRKQLQIVKDLAYGNHSLEEVDIVALSPPGAPLYLALKAVKKEYRAKVLQVLGVPKFDLGDTELISNMIQRQA